MSWNVDCLHTNWDHTGKTSQTSSSWVETVVVRWPTIITWHKGLLFWVPMWVWLWVLMWVRLWVLEEPRGECFLPKFLGCEMYLIPSPLQAWLCCQNALNQIPTLQVLIQAHPQTDSRRTPRDLRNTHLEDTWSLCWERSREKSCRAIRKQAAGSPVNWWLRCTWRSSFPRMHRCYVDLNYG